MLTEKNIRTLWMRMTEIYGNQWIKAHGDYDENNTWLKGLTGVTPSQVANGLSKCLTLIWPPSLPEFRLLCLNLPDKSLAISEAINNHNSNDPFIIKMRTLIGGWNLTHCNYRELNRLAETAYKQASEQVIAIQMQLTQPQQQTTDKRLSHDYEQT